MAAIKGTPAELRQMARVKGAVTVVLLPFRQNTEAAIVVGALLQICKILLRLYPARTRDELILGAVTFLKDDQPEEQAKPMITIPGKRIM